MKKINNKFQFLITIFIFFIPWLRGIFNNELALQKLTAENIINYQQNPCELSVFSFLKINNLSSHYTFRFDSYSDITCFAKIQYIEPLDDGYVVFIGMNMLMSILIQAIVWLSLIALIKKKIAKDSFTLEGLLTSILFTFHLISEPSFYSKSNLDYSNQIEPTNYLLLSFFLSIFLITYFISTIISPRLHILIMYFPFMFLIGGVFTGTNINFFVVLLVFYGFKNFINLRKINLILNSSYMIILYFWINNDIKTYSYFDVDKVIGLSATSNNSQSLFFWGFVFLLMINGIIYIINKSEHLDYVLIYKNFVFSGFLVVLFGLLSTINSLINNLIFFYFGQNKPGSSEIESIAGNTWRGFSPSAEMIGEFYGIILLFTIYFVVFKKLKLENYEVIFLLFIIYGFARANNVSAFVTLAFIALILLIQNYINQKNVRLIIYLVLIFVSSISAYYILRQNTYASMGQSIVYEGLSATLSGVEDSDKTKRLLEERDFISVLNFLTDRELVSSSLSIKTEVLTSQGNISNIPNIVAIFGTLGLFINRAEKWGIFFARYDPGLSEFLFGYGPYNLVNYNFDNLIQANGLILPHSSFLTSLVFFGVFGMFLIIVIFLRKLLIHKDNKLIVSSIMFILINYLKSDSVMYLPSFMMIIFFFHALKKKVL
jgi:hypothetical protein